MKATKRVLMGEHSDVCCVAEDTEFHQQIGFVGTASKHEGDILKKMIEKLKRKGVKPGTKLKITIETVRVW